MTDQGRLLKCIEDYLADYNVQSKTRMDLVLFQYAAEHVCRIMRIIKQPFGNALLVRTFIFWMPGRTSHDHLRQPVCGPANSTQQPCIVAEHKHVDVLH